jgi:hypothetical protein
MKVVGELWEHYRQAVIRWDAPPGQVTECELAFYAGAASLMTLFRKIGGDEELDEAAGVRALGLIEDELRMFAESVRDEGAGGE